jgi:hypothetical protein
VGNEAKEVLIFPSGSESFVREWNLARIGLQNVEGEAAEYCQVGRAIIFSAPGIIFADKHIELPVQVIFDGPVSSDVGEKFLDRQEKREGIGALLVGGLAVLGAPSLDACDGDKVDESVPAWRLLERNDEGAPDVVAAMAVFLGLMEASFGISRCGIEGGVSFPVELGLIGFDGKDVVAALLADGDGHSAMAMQSVASDNGGVQGEEIDRFDGRSGSVRYFV